MSDRTTNTEGIDRDAVADRVNDLAGELRFGENVTLRVGNKDGTHTAGNSGLPNRRHERSHGSAGIERRSGSKSTGNPNEPLV